MTNATIVCERVDALRRWMREKGLSAFVFPSSDPHNSEYPPEHWATRRWISGFRGSAGTAVVTLRNAALWTDSRYFLAAAEELAGTPFDLMKERMPETPTIAQWLISELHADEGAVGIEGAVYASDDALALKLELKQAGLAFTAIHDPATALWKDRPVLPQNPIVVHPECFAGESTDSKVARLQTKLKALGCEGMLVSALDEVAWLLNLRGRDVACNPVFVAYALVLPTGVRLYTELVKCTDEVRSSLAKLSTPINILPYRQIFDDLPAISSDVQLLLPTGCNYSLSLLAPQAKHAASPIALMKAVKNATEIEGFRNAMKRDGVAMVRFLRWLKPAVAVGGETELSVDKKLTELRAEGEHYIGLSFDTIAGYSAHGAIVHYEATPETDVALRPEGLLLLDSGAQYLDGTTDITRTIALGTPTEEERHINTLVLKGHIALSRAVFPEGTCGTQLDLAARYAMWQEGINYGHGTGHGVGSCLCVHEGPHQIRMNHVPPTLQAGMTVTDEPGIYLPGRFGVRIENTLLIVPHATTEFGTFLAFEPLTLCPIDTSLIELENLTPTEREWLNDYHARVNSELMPLLADEADRQWLAAATKPI